MLLQTVTTLTQESIDSLRNSLYERGRSEKTIQAYTTDLRIFLTAMGGAVPMDQFEQLAMNWLQTNRQTMAPKTTGRRLTSLRTFALWAGVNAPLAGYSAPTPPRAVPHPLPEGMAGVRALADAATMEHHRALIGLCGMVGCRIGEALSLQAWRFNYEGVNVDVTIRGKGDKTRVVPVSPEAFEIIAPSLTKAWLNGGMVVPLHDRHARSLITTLGERCGLQRRISSHDLRATFGTAVYEKTKDIRLVQELLGHESVDTTQLYVGIKYSQMREAVVL